MCGRPYAPKGAAWDAAVARWRTLPTDDGAAYDKSMTIDASALEPMITFGTNPGMGIPITAAVPNPGDISDPLERDSLAKALRYMDLAPGKPLLGHPVNVVFIGSCTNSRISDLRSAARILKGRKVHPGVRVMVVPGSQQVKEQAQAEGLDRIFRDAGRRVARGRLLHVHRDERRSVAAGRIQRLHQQSQFRRPARQGRPDVSGQPAHRRGHRRSPASSPTSGSFLQ